MAALACESPFELAKKNLHVKHIYLQNSIVKTAASFDRNELRSGDHFCEYFNGCDKLTYFIADRIHENDKENHWYKFSYSAGVRVVRELIEGEELGDDDVLVEIKATFDVFYASEVEVSSDATDAFADQNVQYHVWPFWREYVHSVCGRIGVAPSIEVPSYIISRAANKAIEK
jgi:hypothetical protein